MASSPPPLSLAAPPVPPLLLDDGYFDTMDFEFTMDDPLFALGDAPPTSTSTSILPLSPAHLLAQQWESEDQQIAEAVQRGDDSVAAIATWVMDTFLEKTVAALDRAAPLWFRDLA